HLSSGFVRVPTVREGEVKIRSSFLCHEIRADHPVQVLSGWMGHVLVEEEGSWKIGRKLVCLLDAGRAHHNLTFLV
ncbi:aromatic-ring-hydroxylating dioxygenase subunit beta, partial [Mangrovicoccus sp. HB161399]|uniref:aromatic-ring-hydroxylating dioxygenase subunit beta n=1 Tax=Mangrovicoccus sp. HB161399 TaxID=2720392 RepID=UPI001C130E84